MPTIDHTTVKLGKAPKRADRRTLQLRNFLRPTGTVPPTVRWDYFVDNYEMLLNDQIGDCTIATVGHMERTWTSADEPRVPYGISTEDVLRAYIRVTGMEGGAYDPRTGANDNGAVVLDVLNLWRQEGIGGHKIAAYAEVNPRSKAEVKYGVATFGGVYLGVNLPLTARDQIAADKRWEVRGHSWLPWSPAHPGSWGGHAVPIVGYDDKMVYVATWGAVQPMTWGFLGKYCVAPETRVLTDDLQWIAVGDMDEGDRLLGFDEEAEHPRGNRGYSRHWHRSQVQETQMIKRPCFDLTFEDGTTIRASAEHKWLTTHGGGAKWMTTAQMRCHGPHLASNVVKPLDTWNVDTSRDGGYLAAAFDGEGCLSQRDLRNDPRGVAATRLEFAQRDNAMREHVAHALKERGFVFTEDNQYIGKFCISQRREVLRALGSLRPHRLLEKFDPELLGQVSMRTVKLAEKRDVGEQWVTAMKTSTGTFVAEGFASHNCDEAYAVLPETLWTGVDRKSPTGVDFDALLLAMRAVTADLR
jgi:hypothetical protein